MNPESAPTSPTIAQFELFLPDPAATLQLGVDLSQVLGAGSVLLLEGELGSGKTTLTQGLGQGLGIQETVDSPTFTLVNEYLDGRLPLYHFDLYRLSSAEAAALAIETYWDAIEVEPGIVVIEWSERLPYQPQSYLQLGLTYDPNSGRQSSFSAIGEPAIAVLNALQKTIREK